jgi:2-haloacid dehalogenase/putative hydrolase of the HAD superfamily
MDHEVTWPRAILLDFYGTVVEEDHVPITAICDRIAQASLQDVTTSEVAVYWGRRFGQLCSRSYGAVFRPQREVERISLREVLQHFDADLDEEQLSQTLYDYWMRPTLFPESTSIIGQCTLPICLVSNIDDVDLRSALSQTGLRFDYVVTSDGCRAYKPRPEPFQVALSLLGLSSGDVLHVGDSLGSDVRGARDMGIPVLWVNRQNRLLPSNQALPDHTSADLCGLLSLLGPVRHGGSHAGT